MVRLSSKDMNVTAQSVYDTITSKDKETQAKFGFSIIKNDHVNFKSF